MDVEIKSSKQNPLTDLVLLQHKQIDSLQKQVKLLTNAVDVLDAEVEELKTKV
tara:strand:+ start:48 stop:206 length:159 start_codon:yes stop_codon:yes gene_type:complete